jgi:hypothetical protein
MGGHRFYNQAQGRIIQRQEEFSRIYEKLTSIHDLPVIKLKKYW